MTETELKQLLIEAFRTAREFRVREATHAGLKYEVIETGSYSTSEDVDSAYADLATADKWRTILQSEIVADAAVDALKATGLLDQRWRPIEEYPFEAQDNSTRQVGPPVLVYPWRHVGITGAIGERDNHGTVRFSCALQDCKEMTNPTHWRYLPPPPNDI